jgi:hypothetical protein
VDIGILGSLQARPSINAGGSSAMFHRAHLPKRMLDYSFRYFIELANDFYGLLRTFTKTFSLLVYENAID